MSEDNNGLSWIELIAKNPNVEKLLIERNIGLKKLHKLPKVEFLNKKLSKDQLVFILDDVYDLARSALYKHGKKDGTNDLGNMIIHGVSRVAEHQSKVRSVPITESYRSIDGLSLEEVSHDTSHINDDGDYGCHGYFEILTCSLDGKDIFRYTMSCDCHKDDVAYHGGKMINYDYVDGHYYSVDVLSKNYSGALTILRNLNTRDKKKEKLDELVEKAGMSIAEIKRLVT